MRSARLLFALAATAMTLVACGTGHDDDEPAPPPVEVRSANVSVLVDLAPLRITIRDGQRVVLASLAGGSADPYGGPGATRDDGIDATKVLPGWDGYSPDERPWSHAGRARVISKSDTSASFEAPLSGGTIALEVKVEGRKVRLIQRATGGDFNKSTLSFVMPPDEHFFGLGERYASVDHRGLSMYSWAEEGATGRGEKAPVGPNNPGPNGPSMTYFPVPFFIGSSGFAMHLATTFRTETHFASERPDAWRVAVNANALETVVYVNEDPLASLDDYTRDTGRPFVPASWVFGPRRRVSNRDTAPDGTLEWRKLRDARVPTTGVDDAVHFLPARSELGREAELAEWTKTAHAWGYKVMAYNNPYIATSKPEARPDLEHGTANGFFALTADGAVAETEFISGELLKLATIDLTKPEAVAWFQDLLRRSLALGYDGWMHDFGEYVRRGWKFSDGRRGDEIHNLFPVLSAKAAHDLLTKERPGDFLFFVRSGYVGTQQYVPAVWSGDPEATFDTTQGLPAMLRGGLNLGMTGVPLWGSDLTGFKCITDDPYDKEIYLRWAEVGAVSPIMMEQNACSNPFQRRTKWKLWNDEETIRVYADMARLHTRLMPYFEVLAREANATGIPIMRHPFLLHPREPEAWKTDSTFYLGPSLFTAPVVERGATTKTTWLPPGRWVDFLDHSVQDGGKVVTVPAPLDRLPLFLRDGGIVPLLDATVETLAPATEPSVVTLEKMKDRLDVIVALGPDREARITLADGTELVARRGPAGSPSTLPAVSVEALPACDAGCVNETSEPAIDRLRVTTPLGTEHSVTHQDMTLSVSKSPLARRVRWDVLRIK